jgi:hypothetical protein
MSNTRTVTMCALAAAGVLFIGSQVSDRQAIAQGPPNGLNVTVGNTPLPVTVTNPTVPPTTVNVGNPAALAAANAQAFRGTPVAFSLGPLDPPYSVPVGQRLVIEYVSARCDADHPVGGPPNGIFVPPSFGVVTNGRTIFHYIAMPVVSNHVPPPENNFEALLSVGSLVKIYADPGTTIDTGVRNCFISFSGQLVTP